VVRRPRHRPAEELAAAPERVADDVLATLGLEPEPGRRAEVPPELTRQADSVNDAWAARYRELARLDPT
jgi:LPS sulfotransferase NodH